MLVQSFNKALLIHALELLFIFSVCSLVSPCSAVNSLEEV